MHWFPRLTLIFFFFFLLISVRTLRAATLPVASVIGLRILLHNLRAFLSYRRQGMGRLWKTLEGLSFKREGETFQEFIASRISGDRFSFQASQKLRNEPKLISSFPPSQGAGSCCMFTPSSLVFFHRDHLPKVLLQQELFKIVANEVSGYGCNGEIGDCLSDTTFFGPGSVRSS